MSGYDVVLQTPRYSYEDQSSMTGSYGQSSTLYFIITDLASTIYKLLKRCLTPLEQWSGTLSVKDINLFVSRRLIRQCTLVN